MGGAKEFDKTADNAGLNDALDGRVAFLGKQLSEFGGSLDLFVDLVRKYPLYHLGEFDVELIGNEKGCQQTFRPVDNFVENRHDV